MGPLIFEPYLRPMVWGSRRLQSLGKELPSSGSFGESWEISGHPHHVSRVAEGSLRGNLLTELCRAHAAELFGPGGSDDPGFPLLIKLLDCHDLLSIQVHPDDKLAARLAPGERGKTEAWLILDVAPEGKIYAGLTPGTTRADVEQHLQAGTLAQCLHAFTPKPGDCIFLPAGTVHAVGGGVLMAEVQQSSDATFRLFDWNRPGPDGKPRTLHVREALEAIDWTRGPVQPVTATPIRDLPGSARGEHLVRCRYFSMDRLNLSEPLAVPGGRLSIWMVLDGSAELQADAGAYRRTFRRGNTVLVPASATASWKPAGSVTLLEIQLPAKSANE